VFFRFDAVSLEARLRVLDAGNAPKPSWFVCFIGNDKILKFIEHFSSRFTLNEKHRGHCTFGFMIFRLFSSELVVFNA